MSKCVTGFVRSSCSLKMLNRTQLATGRAATTSKPTGRPAGPPAQSASSGRYRPIEHFAQADGARDRLASIKLQLDAVDRSHDEMAELAVKAFELSQTLGPQWLTADYAAKRRILEIVLSNCTLNDATLCPTIKKTLDVLAEKF